jgi:hypothetical protein
MAHPLPVAWKLWHVNNTFEDGKAKDVYTHVSLFSDVQAFWANYKLVETIAPNFGPNHGISIMRDGESPRWQEQTHRPGRICVRIDHRKRGVGVAGVLKLFEELLMLAVGGTMGEELFGVSITNKNVTHVLYLWHEGNVESPELLDHVRDLLLVSAIPATVEYHPLY